MNFIEPDNEAYLLDALINDSGVSRRSGISEQLTKHGLILERYYSDSEFKEAFQTVAETLFGLVLGVKNDETTS